MLKNFTKPLINGLLLMAAFLAGSSSASAQDKLSIGAYSGALTDLPALVAQSEGLFKANGLAVEMIDFASGSMAVAALQGGSVDVISNSGTNQQIVNGNTASVNKRLVQIYSQYPGATWNLVVGKNVVVDPSGDLKKTLLNLKGKTIGIPVVGSEGHAIAGYLFKYAGLNSNTDVSYIGVGVGPQAVSSFQAGQIDAVIVIPPVDALLRSRGGRTVFDMSKSAEIEKDKELSLLSKWSFATYLTTSERAEAAAPKLTKFQSAMDEAIRFIKDPVNTRRVAQIWSAKNATVPVEQLAQSIAATRDGFTGRIDCGGLASAAQFSVEVGMMKQKDVKTCDELVWKGAAKYLQR